MPSLLSSVFKFRRSRSGVPPTKSASDSPIVAVEEKHVADEADNEQSPDTGGYTDGWMACQDAHGQPFWWNQLTGQWTYVHPYFLDQQQRSFASHLMMPQEALLYQSGAYALMQQNQQQNPWLVSAQSGGGWGAASMAPYMFSSSAADSEAVSEEKTSNVWEMCQDGTGIWFWKKTLANEKAGAIAAE